MSPPGLRRLFLLDGLGALLTAVLTGLVLAHFAELVGMPRWVLRGLGLVAVFLAAYSLREFCFFSTARQHRLATLAVANVGYCTVALGFVFWFRASVTPLGAAYFLLETVIVVSLATVEWRAGKTKRPPSQEARRQ